VMIFRRADIVRERIVHNLTLTSLNPTTIQVDLETSAGLYVKEFMHGDEGRTVPFIGGLLDVDVAVKSLDVLGVDLEWPVKRSDYEECARIVDKAVEIDLKTNI
jgi:tRNA pseudouridine synthase 10